MLTIVQRACDGDERAFEEMLQLHRAKLIATAFSYTKDYMAAQDVVQETSMKAYSALHQLKEPAYFATWLYKILIRECLHYMKKEKRAAQLVVELQQLQLDDPTLQFDTLYDALGELKENYRSVLLLHYFYDFKLYEIASIVDRPLNTVKTQLHRARLQLKDKLEGSMQRTIQQQEVNGMFKQIALQYVSVPDSFSLAIEDIDENEATFVWKQNDIEDGYYIKVSRQGKLLSLSQPVQLTEERKSTDELQMIAEQFMTAQYADALDYVTLMEVKAKETSNRFYYKQLVAGVPLFGSWCTIEVAHDGQLMNFEYRPYVVTPPHVPATFAKTAPILEQLHNANWTTELQYISSDYYDVAQSGLYVVYHSTFLYHSFDAQTGDDLSHDDEEIKESDETYVPLRAVTCDERHTTLEKIIGVPPSMVRIRETDVDDDCIGIVWRDETYEQPTDKSMEQFLFDRFEETVKATVHKETGELRGFVWFKERAGNLSLNYKQCEDIALRFIQTYYAPFVPYLRMEVKESTIERRHAFFHFALFVDETIVQGEFFRLSVNKKTGFIDMLMAPRLSASVLHAFCKQPLMPLEEAKHALCDVEAQLEWDKRYELDDPVDMLIYRFKHRGSGNRVQCIDAVSGQLIVSTEW